MASRADELNRRWFLERDPAIIADYQAMVLELESERDEARRAYCNLHMSEFQTPGWTVNDWRRKAADDAFGPGTGAALFPEES